MKYDKWRDISYGDYIYLNGMLYGVDHIFEDEIYLISLEDLSETTVTPSHLPDLDIAHRLNLWDKGLVLPKSLDLILDCHVRLTNDQRAALVQHNLHFEVVQVLASGDIKGSPRMNLTPSGSLHSWWLKTTMVVPFKIGSNTEVLFPEALAVFL